MFNDREKRAMADSHKLEGVLLLLVVLLVFMLGGFTFYHIIHQVFTELAEAFKGVMV